MSIHLLRSFLFFLRLVDHEVSFQLLVSLSVAVSAARTLNPAMPVRFPRAGQ